jgi:hypothetical protein
MGSRVRGSGFRIQGLGFGVWVQALGFEGQGSESRFEVLGRRFRV